MATELTKADYLRIVDSPKRRFRTLRLKGSRVSLADRISAPSYWFERNDAFAEGRKYWRDPSRASITLMIDGRPSLLLYLVRRRLDTCTFAYDLTPVQLDETVVVMKEVGLHRLVAPAAEWAIREMPERRRPVLERALRSLARSSGGNPSRRSKAPSNKGMHQTRR
jgi:hypothetical protein